MFNNKVLHTGLGSEREITSVFERSFSSLARLLLSFAMVQELVIGLMVSCNSSCFLPLHSFL